MFILFVQLIILLIRFNLHAILLSPPNDIFHAESVIFFQSAALMSLGILYEGSAHPQTMQVLLVTIFLIFIVCSFNA